MVTIAPDAGYSCNAPRHLSMSDHAGNIHAQGLYSFAWGDGVMASHIFIFAHPDDEFGVFALLESIISRGNRAIVIYLTNGAYQKQSALIRNEESIKVLAKIGVPSQDIHFIGYQLGIEDGFLVEHLDLAYQATVKLLTASGEITGLYLPAWEGGHQDHDAAHIAGLAAARRMGLGEMVYQYPLYHGKSLPWILFRIQNPITENGQVTKSPVSAKSRFRHLGYCLGYLSQWKTWVGIFPFKILEAMMDGHQKLQRAQFSRVWLRPHAGPLLYEKRNMYSYTEFSRIGRPFLKRHFDRYDQRQAIRGTIILQSNNDKSDSDEQ